MFPILKSFQSWNLFNLGIIPILRSFNLEIFPILESWNHSNLEIFPILRSFQSSTSKELWGSGGWLSYSNSGSAALNPFSHLLQFSVREPMPTRKTHLTACTCMQDGMNRPVAQHIHSHTDELAVQANMASQHNRCITGCLSHM